MVEGRRVRIIHGLNISHKELIYLLQKSTSYQSKVLYACSQGDRLVGKDNRSSPTATHKEDNEKTSNVPTSLHNSSPYMHATGLRNHNTSSTTYQHDPNIAIFTSQNDHKESNFSQYSMHFIWKFYYIPLGCLSYQD